MISHKEINPTYDRAVVAEDPQEVRIGGFPKAKSGCPLVRSGDEMMYRNVPQNGPHRGEDAGRKRLNSNQIRPICRTTIASILSHKCTAFPPSHSVATCRTFVALLSHCCRPKAENLRFSSTFCIWHCRTRAAMLPVLALSIWLHEFNTRMPQLASCLVFLILQDTNAFAYCQRDTSSTRESLAVRMNRMTQNDAKQLGKLCEKLVKPMSYDLLNDAYGIKLISPTARRKYMFIPQKAGVTGEKDRSLTNKKQELSKYEIVDGTKSVENK